MALERARPVLSRKRKRNSEYQYNGRPLANRNIINSSHLQRESSFSTPVKPKSVPENFSRQKVKDWTKVGNSEDDKEGEDGSITSKVFNLLKSAVTRSVLALVSFKHEPEDKESLLKRRKVDGKRKKKDISDTRAKNKTIPQNSKKNNLEKALSTFNPDIKDGYKDVSFISKPIIDWDQEAEVASEDTHKENSHDYGTKFIRRGKKHSTPNVEANYMRAIYTGQYRSPTPATTTPPTPSTASEEEKIRINELQVLTNNLSKSWKNNVKSYKDDDVIILKEVKLPPPTPSSYSLKFDVTALTFDQEFKFYQKMLNDKKRIQAEIRKKKQEALSTSKLVQKLAKDDEDKVLNIWKSSGKDRMVILQAHNIDVTVADFKTLADKRWLNDVVIELFLRSMITEKVFAFNSYFFTTLESKGYQGVQRWMKRQKVNISKLDKILIPINVHQTHWVLGTIDLKNKKILYMDSLASKKTPHGERALHLMNEFLKGETAKQGFPELSKGYTMEHMLNVPQQQNGFDCGVFTLLNAFYLSKDEPLTYQPSDATTFRRIIGNTILGLSPK